MRITGLTDPGLVRDNNEDAIDWVTEQGLLILADGMGGHNAGEVASLLAVEASKHSMLAALPELQGGEAMAAALHTAVARANLSVYENACSNPGQRGMGTTLVLACIQGNNLQFANVGDSRLYHYNSDGLQQVSRDHSLIAEWVDKGFMSAEDARNSDQKNIITRAIGLAAEVEIDLFQQQLQPGDICLICSDGLTDVVDDESIAGLLTQHADDLEGLPQRLVDSAKQAGGPDNISVILVQL